MIIPPKPQHRARRVNLWRYLRLFRQDLLSAQPEHLYRAKMAGFRTPFFRSYLLNQPELIDVVLKERPDDFPKSERIAEGLRPLLGQSVFLTNGDTWKRQRRIIDPAFAHGRLKDSFQSVCDAAVAASDQIEPAEADVEPLCSHAAADVIFRALFSIPIETPIADLIYQEFRRYQQSQPLLNFAAFIPLPRWMPRPHRGQTRQSAKRIREMILKLTMERRAQITAGQAPDDLCTKIMTFTDPESGKALTNDEMVDQVAIFLLAGHETSASALAWALYLVSLDTGAQEAIRREGNAFWDEPHFSKLSLLKTTRSVFRETLRLYPPVPMMVRESTGPNKFRGRDIKPGSQLVISPWHLHRNDRYWSYPDTFDPARFDDPAQRKALQSAFLPFSTGPRVCPGAGFAMMEACLMLSRLVRDWKFEPVESAEPQPSAYLTVRSRNGIRLRMDRAE